MKNNVVHRVFISREKVNQLYNKIFRVDTSLVKMSSSIKINKKRL